ncbi:MAG: hypothetical protein PHV63_01825 [Candidatus Daviesbacteria bacterium]|nr:hypothetical protein [Candidatus Daviesbacteria bacterium]
MEQQIEIRSEKTPGDLKREEIAVSLGESFGSGWQFCRNYMVGLKEPGESVSFLSKLESDRRDGKIKDWRASKPAFDDDGRELPFSQVRAAYIKSKPPESKIP